MQKEDEEKKWDDLRKMSNSNQKLKLKSHFFGGEEEALYGSIIQPNHD